MILILLVVTVALLLKLQGWNDLAPSSPQQGSIDAALLASNNTWTGTNTFNNTLSIGASSDTTKTLTFNAANQTTGTAVTFNTGAQTASRIASLPVLAGNDTFAMLAVANTFTATNTFAGINATSIGATTPGTIAATTISASGQITSTLAGGTAPFVVASSTVVANLNVSQLLGQTWANPGAIGGTTPATTFALSGILTSTNTTNASSSLLGAVVIGNGTAATSIGMGAGNIVTGGIISAGTTLQTLNGNLVITNTSSNAIATLNAATGTSVLITFQVNGTSQHQFNAGATNLHFFDSVNAITWFTYTPGAAGANFTTFAATLDASSSTVAANVMSGGLAVAKSVQIGTSLTVGTTISNTNGNVNFNNTGGACTLTVNGSSGHNAILSYNAAGTTYYQALGNSAQYIIYDAQGGGVAYNALVYTSGTQALASWNFPGTLAANAAATTGSVTFAGGVAGQVFQAVTGFGVGNLPTAAIGVNVASSTATANYGIQATNSNAGTGAYAQIIVSNGSVSGGMLMFGTGWTTAGVEQAGVLGLIHGGTAGIAIAATNAGGSIALAAGGTTSMATLASSGTFTHAPPVANATARHILVLTAPADTLVTSATEQHDLFLNTSRTVQWATSTPTTQRSIRIGQPTYSCNTAAQTIATAVTVNILGAPIAGTNVSITNSYALWVNAGLSRFGGSITIDDGFNINLNSTTGTQVGSATSQKLAFWGGTPTTQKTGYGTPTAASLTASLPGTGSTLAQVGGTLAQLILDMKSMGLLGA